MKLLVITPISHSSYYSGGAERYIFELIRQIASKSNIEVEVLTSAGDEQNLGSHDSKVRITYLTTSLFTFPISILFNLWKYVGDTDIIIENVSKFPLVIPAVISKILRKPFIAIIHHIHGRTLFVELPIVLALFFLIYEYVSLTIYALLKVPVITVSYASKIELSKLGFKNIYVINPTLPCSANDINNTISKSERPLLVYVGRIKRYKRVDHVVKTCHLVLKEIPEVFCLIVGKGDTDMERKLRKLASNLGINERTIIHVCNISENLKHKILKKAWLYIFTSMKEGFGISIAEALSQEVPVVAYDIPAVREFMKKCGSGILAVNGDIKELAKQCITLLKNRDLLKTMTRGARKCVDTCNDANYRKSFFSVIKHALKQVKRR